MTKSKPQAAPASAAPKKALRQLQAGNRRFVARASRAGRAGRNVLQDLVRQQRPYAAILCCSDSRVPPELIFDAGLGQLFVVRVAGNVYSPEVAGSLVFAAARLGTRFILVMGHRDCGAVKAAVAAKAHGTIERSRIHTLVDHILPGLSDLDMQLPQRALLDAAVEANVRWTMRRIQETPEAGAALAAGNLALAGAVYDLRTGRVRLLP